MSGAGEAVKQGLGIFSPSIPGLTGGAATSSASSGNGSINITTGGGIGKSSSLWLWGLGALAAWYILKK